MEVAKGVIISVEFSFNSNDDHDEEEEDDLNPYSFVVEIFTAITNSEIAFIIILKNAFVVSFKIDNFVNFVDNYIDLVTFNIIDVIDVIDVVDVAIMAYCNFIGVVLKNHN